MKEIKSKKKLKLNSGNNFTIFKKELFTNYEISSEISDLVTV